MTLTERYAIGIDYGTESGRVMLVHVEDGREAAFSVVRYRHGVLDRMLPDGTPLGSEWALQHPSDYLQVLEQGIPEVLSQTGVNPSQIVGIGTDFTSCTILPTLRDGTPLCLLPEWRHHPHAWVKLWKHHAAQPQADRVNEVGADLDPDRMRIYGGRVSSEWLLPKTLQILEEAPEVYARAERILEAGDWIIWQMTGEERRNECAAGYKGMWVKRTGYPDRQFLSALHPGLAGLVEEKLSATLWPLGALAGGLTPAMAARCGLLAGTPVAVGHVDAHAGVPASGVVEPGALVMIMGTSLCHMLLSAEPRLVEGVAGMIEDGIVPGTWGYEAGQSAVGDLYGWCFRCLGREPEELTSLAARLQPGESGLLALDWWAGNRSVLMNADLSGLLIGMTLQTRPEEIYRALIEGTAFGTLTVIRAFERQGVSIDRLVACGGLAQNSPLVVQIFADVTNRSITLPRSLQASGLGAAMHGAVAAGVFNNIQQAARQMGGRPSAVVQPNAAAAQVYQQMYQEYERLHDLFGRGGTDVMTRLRRLKEQAVAQAAT